MKLLLILLFTNLSVFLFGQDSMLVEAIKESLHEFSFDDGVLHGNGHDFLLDKAANSPYFLIGENHGIAETALVSAALFHSFKPLGYAYYATEVGPFTASMLQSMSKTNMDASLQKHFKDYPFSIPFFNWQEEARVLEAAMNNTSIDGPIIWGLDQEFAASFRMFFKKLEVDATTEDSRALAHEYYTLAEKTFSEALETKNPGNSLLTILTPSDFEKLRQHFEGQPNSTKLIDALEESIQIYQLWFTREGYRSNYLRAELMKRNFTTYLEQAKLQDENPRVMIKLGASHQYRGLNGLNIPDIGNFISELASLEEKKSFHLYVVGRKGSQNTYNPFSQSEADKSVPFDAAIDDDYRHFSSVLEASSEALWTVIDLLPLRHALHNKKVKNVHPQLEKIIWGYDAILLIPEVHAATNY